MSLSIQEILESANFLLNRQEKKYLLQSILGVNIIYLMTHGDEILTQQAYAKFLDWHQQRLNGVPLAYLRQTQEFYGLTFYVNPSVLIPRADTEILVECVLKDVQKNLQKDIQENRAKKYRILDMGTGSGAIILTLAKQMQNFLEKLKVDQSMVEYEACDIAQDALNVARKNALSLGLDTSIKFYLSDWWLNLGNGKKWDMIVSNPPYIAANDEHLSGNICFEPRHALTDESDGLAHLSYIIQHAPQYLNESGCLYLEHGYDQAPAVYDLCTKAGFEQIEQQQDLGGNWRVTKAKL